MNDISKGEKEVNNFINEYVTEVRNYSKTEIQCLITTLNILGEKFDYSILIEECGGIAIGFCQKNNIKDDTNRI